MTEIKVTNPTTIARFVQSLAEHGVKLPLVQSPNDVDVNRERSDEDVAWIVGMIQVAVNT